MPAIQKPGKPWLYDTETGDIIGVKDPDGSEQYFATSREPIPAGAVPVVGQVNELTGVIRNSTGDGGFVTLNPPPVGDVFDVMPMDAAVWSSDKTAALTVELDTSVLFNGCPTIKITIPAGTSGVCKVGCSAADGYLPYNWDRQDLVAATMVSGFTGYDMSSTFPPTVIGYIGDAAYSNFFTTSGYNGANFPEQKARQGEWWVYKPPVSGWAATGTPLTALGDGTNLTAQRCRVKFQWTQVSQATDCYIWIGLFGKMPKRKKPTLIWTLDDGYASWYSFVAPLFKHYDMPVSMGIDSGLVGSANYLTAAQIKELFDDKSCLFDFVNHGVSNQSYNTLGAAGYYQTLETTRRYLQGIGVYGDGPLHHPYVQSVLGNDLIDLMKTGGYLSARAANAGVVAHGKDQLMGVEDKDRWLTNIASPLVGTKTLAQAKSDVDGIVSNNTMGMINAHDFVASSPTTYQWSCADMRHLVGYVAALRDAGSLEVKSWSRWYADLTGRVSDRR